MHTGERKAELAATLAATRHKLKTVSLPPEHKAIFARNLDYLDGSTAHVLETLRRAEGDTEAILKAIRDLQKHINAELKKDEPAGNE